MNSPLIVVVVSRAGEHVKIPEWEQILSAGAVCMNLVTAAHALGFGANWLTGWLAYDQSCNDLLGVGPSERVAGIIHIGTPGGAREDRPRRDDGLERIVRQAVIVFCSFVEHQSVVTMSARFGRGRSAGSVP